MFDNVMSCMNFQGVSPTIIVTRGLAFQLSSWSFCMRGLFYRVGHGSCSWDSPMAVGEFSELDGDEWGGSSRGLAIRGGEEGSDNT